MGAAHLKFIVGLGNPGFEYTFTPHNLGFMGIDCLAETWGVKVQKREAQALTGRAKMAEGEVLLAKPQTYMNLSGVAVSKLLKKYSMESQDMVVLMDDLDLPLGMIRIRQRGTAGGHNGLKSIIAALQTDQFIRVRMGTQPDRTLYDSTSFLLEKYQAEELEAIPPLLDRAQEAVQMILREGPQKAMAKFNRRVALGPKRNGG